ncbi:hypothetical protein RDI58_010480 [Solanum bulbocastanum]|uniref:Uncharacterized protein n=1 Tax=Solanum bulbocastanum TaxID=147425 RepID=A0AAN8TPI3_SOLBU
MPGIKPTALQFYGSSNVTVIGITIHNSPQCHLKFDNCIGVSISVSHPLVIVLILMESTYRTPKMSL